MLEGDDTTVLALFEKLLGVFRDGGVITAAGLTSAREEFATFVVDLRIRRRATGQRVVDDHGIMTSLCPDCELLLRYNILSVFQ